MCEPKPGTRCASDTQAASSTAVAAYEQAIPDGPPVDPVTRAEERARMGDRRIDLTSDPIAHEDLYGKRAVTQLAEGMQVEGTLEKPGKFGGPFPTLRLDNGTWVKGGPIVHLVEPPAAQPISVEPDGSIDPARAPSEAREWARALETTRRGRMRARDLPAGGEHVREMAYEAVMTRHLAILRNPKLADNGTLTSDQIGQAAAPLMRASVAEIAEQPAPAPLDDTQRARAIGLFADQASTASLGVAPDAGRGVREGCMVAVARLGAGEREALAEPIHATLTAHTERHGRPPRPEETIAIVNQWRASANMSALTRTSSVGEVSLNRPRAAERAV